MATVELEDEVEVVLRESEDERVVGWRAERLLEAGFDEFVALELSLRRDVDLHRATRLLRSGCPPEMARRILL